MVSARGLLLSISCLALAGCGNPAPPSPPSLHLAQPVHDLAAARTGDRVRLTWTMSNRSTDQLLLKGQQAVQICRGTLTGPCIAVDTTHRAPGEVAQYDDRLPAALVSGPHQLLRYQVQLINRNGRSAGQSNTAYAADGQTPPAVADVLAVATAQGIVVRWSTRGPTELPPPGAKLFVRLTRERVLRHGESARPTRQETNAGVPQPVLQTLEAPESVSTPEGWSPRQVLDRNAGLNRVYRYTVQLLEQEPLDGRPQQLAGDAATGVAVSAKDRFAPAAPTEVAAVGNPASGAIDLSWTPGAEGTAGYLVYRRVDGSAKAAVRISGARPVAVPAYSDSAVVPGTRYVYSVSAVDASGNESARSAEANEVAPAKP